MPKYYVEMTIDFSGELEAESEEAAEALAWESWGDTMDNEITFDDVVHIKVEEIEGDDEEEEN